MAGALVTTNILGTTVAMGLSTLRDKLALVHIANHDYEQEITAAKRFATVSVSVPAEVATRTVAPNVVPPAVTAVTPTSVPVTLTEWQEAPFAMDDKGLQQVDRGIVPMQLAEASKALANYMEDFLWTKITANCYGFSGTSGVTPFATDPSAYLEARKVADRQLMADEPRYMVIDGDAEANALGLRAFQDASFGGGAGVILKGQIGDKMGATWVKSTRVPTHTGGTYTTGTTVTGVNAIGATTIALSGGATGTILQYDIIQIGNYTYNVQANATGGSTPSSVTISPGLFAATAGTEPIVKRGTTFVQNVLIHRDAIAVAVAPLQDTIQLPGSFTAIAIDEASGLALRLEVTRQHKQIQWALDALFGASAVRKTHMVYCAG